jgi:hypothetical protein
MKSLLCIKSKLRCLVFFVIESIRRVFYPLIVALNIKPVKKYTQKFKVFYDRIVVDDYIECFCKEYKPSYFRIYCSLFLCVVMPIIISLIVDWLSSAILSLIFFAMSLMVLPGPDLTLRTLIQKVR